MIGIILRNVGIVTRLGFVSVKRKGLDEDKLHNKFERDPNKPLDRVRTMFDRE